VEVKCDKGFSAYNCKQCKKTCEKPVKIINYERKMCTDKNCNCPPSAHVFQQFSLKPTLAKVTTTLLDMKAEYESNHNRKLKTEDIMANYLDKLNMSKVKMLSLLEQMGANVKSLDSTALRSNALSPAEYLSLMRSRVLEEQKPGYLTRWQTLMELQQSLDAPAVPALTAPKTDKCPVTPAQPGKVNAGSCGRGRGFLLAMGSTGSPSESTHSGRGETPSRSESQNYSGSSKIPPAEGSGTDPRYQSRMSGTNNNVAASTTSASSQRRTEETNEGGGAGRGHGSAFKWQENSVTPAQPGKVNAGSCGRGRGHLLAMGSTGSPSESAHSGRGSAQNYSGASNISSAGTSASGSGTGPNCQSRMSGTNSNVAASTTSASSQRNKNEETKAGGGAGRGSSYSNSGRQVGHPPGEPENYYNNLSGKAHPKRGADDGEFSSEEETEQRAKQPKISEGPVTYFNHFFHVLQSRLDDTAYSETLETFKLI
jgi:hypothetical protein